MTSLALAAAVAPACTAEPSPPSKLVASAPPMVARARVAMPRPDRGRMHEAVKQNDACVGCHADVAAEWKESLHRRADLEPAYRRSFAIEPLPFCRSCHAPEANAMEEEPEEVAAIGVSCVTCHVTGEGNHVLATNGRDAVTPAHGIVRSDAFATAAACASCHQFRFPIAHGDSRDAFMQTTVMEHAASTEKARACADCHMPRRADGKRSHAFIASRSPEVLKSAARIEAKRTGETTVEVEITPVAPGHAFPTGDLFRRLEITAEASGPDHMSLGSASKYLTRHWTTRPGYVGRVLARDDRPTNEPVRITLDVGPKGAGVEIAWRVAYQRVSHPNGIEESDAEIEGEIELASGNLPAPPAGSGATRRGGAGE